MKTIKILIWIVVILAVFGVILSALAYTAWNKISFKFSFKGISFGNTNLQQAVATLVSGGTVTGTISVGADIKNGNSFAIPFSELKAKLFFNGIEIGETSDALYGQKVKVPANSDFSLTDNANIYINKNALLLLQGLLTGTAPVIDYEIRIRIFGIPFPFPIKNNFKLSI